MLMKPFFFCRALDGGWYEMTCTLNIDADILKDPVAYKYVVYSPKMENEDDCYEYLHGYGGIVNRCLKIPPSKFAKAYGGKLIHVFCNKISAPLKLPVPSYFRYLSPV